MKKIYSILRRTIDDNGNIYYQSINLFYSTIDLATKALQDLIDLSVEEIGEWKLHPSNSHISEELWQQWISEAKDNKSTIREIQDIRYKIKPIDIDLTEIPK